MPEVFPTEVGHRIEHASRTRASDLDLSGLSIERLPEEAPNLAHLRLLDLSANHLEHLPKWIGQLHRLETLRLQANRFEQIPEPICQIRDLKVLQLDRNPLVELPTWLPRKESVLAIFVQGTLLSDLSLLHPLVTRLKALGIEAEHLPSVLNELYTSDELNALVLGCHNSSPDLHQLAPLTKLRSLKLVGSLRTLSDSIWELERLQHLDVSNNKLTTLPDSLERLAQLQNLDAWGNQLTTLPDSLGQLAQLRNLDVSFNQLKALPDSLGHLAQLQNLDVSENQLTQLPDSLGQLAQLQNLDVSENQLTKLPDSLGQLAQLQQLDLSTNQLTELPDSLGQLMSLQQLRVWSNQLTALPESLGQLTQLQHLDMSLNQLTALPNSVGQLEQLQQLDLSRNQLAVLPDSVGQLAQLQNLDVTDNQLSALPDSVGRMSRLQQLDVSRNELTALPNRIGQLSQLQQLSVTSNRLTVIPESIGQLAQLEQLSVSANQLKELPESIGELVQLQQLSAWGNQLNVLPASLVQLVQLKQISVSGNRLTALPESIGQLAQLQHLTVADNRLTALPDSVGQLAQLQQLDVSRNQLEVLSDAVGQLANLQVLDVAHNQLTVLSGKVGRLAQLQRLIVSDNQLLALPDSLGQLAELQHLDVSDNQLTALPDSVGQLAELQHLDVSDNQLTALPDSAGQLARLQHLDVSDNQLTALPDSVGQLARLQHLDVSDNQLTALPDSVGQLAQLERLAARGNQLRALPDSVGQLAQLQRLDLSDNQLRTLPASVANLASLAILDLANNRLDSLPNGIRGLPLEVLLLHGNPELGLSASVLGKHVNAPPFWMERKHWELGDYRTPDSILEAFFSQRERDSRPLDEVKLVLVGRGAAGKTSIARRLVRNTFSRSQRETQGIAISPWKLVVGQRKVAVNIWDFAGQVVTHSAHQFFLTENSVYVLVLTGRDDLQNQDAEYWLKLIRAFGAGEDGAIAPVIVALNKFDQHAFRVDRLALKERYPFITCFVETDCATRRGIDALEAAIVQAVEALPVVHQPFKATWRKIKRAVELAQRKRNHLPYSEFAALCAIHGETDPDRQRSLAAIFHALGVALNYGRDERLRDATVLNPQWMTEGIYRLLREAVPPDGTAVLTMAAVRRVLPDEPEDMRRYLVALMQRFDLVFPLNEAEDEWLVPQHLPHEQPDLGSLASAPPELRTRLRIDYPVLPEGLLARFIARTYPLSRSREDGSALPRWLNGVVLQYGSASALVRAEPDERRVTVDVGGEEKDRLELLGVIQSDLRTIHGDIKGLGEVEKMEASGLPGVFVPVKTLRADEKLRRPSSAATDEGTVQLDATLELNRLSEPLARVENIRRARVFISYSSRNASAKDELLMRLKPLKETHGLLELWEDRCIPPGGDWDGDIRRELEIADVIILLVSVPFLASDYVRSVEVKRAVERALAKESIVIPVILEAVDWTGESFGRFNSLPRKSRPINEFRPQSNGWYEVAIELRAELERLRARWQGLEAREAGAHGDAPRRHAPGR